MDTLYFKGFPEIDWFDKPVPTTEQLEEDDFAMMLDAQRSLMVECELENIPVDLLLNLTLGNISDEALEAGRFFGDLTKPWKINLDAPLDDIKEELIDVLHFLLQAFIIVDMNANDIYSLYLQKNRKNWQRIQEKLKELDAKTI